jgi:hypothetical protein
MTVLLSFNSFSWDNEAVTDRALKIMERITNDTKTLPREELLNIASTSSFVDAKKKLHTRRTQAITWRRFSATFDTQG